MGTTSTARGRSAQNNRRPNQRYSAVSESAALTVVSSNIIFWTIGGLCLAVGVWAQFEKDNPYTQLNRLSKFYLDPAWLLILFGGITFVIGFSGCVGALRENTFLLAIYSSLLGLLLLAQLLIVVLVFLSKDFIESEIKTRLDDMVVLYREDADLQSFVDWLQTDWRCCGITRPDDWDMNAYFYFNASSAKAFKSAEAGGVPFSCCIDSRELQNYACGHKTRTADMQHAVDVIYTDGCLPKLQAWFNNNLLYVGGASLVACGVQFLGICFAQDLRHDIFEQRMKARR